MWARFLRRTGVSLAAAPVTYTMADINRLPESFKRNIADELERQEKEKQKKLEPLQQELERAKDQLQTMNSAPDPPPTQELQVRKQIDLLQKAFKAQFDCNARIDKFLKDPLKTDYFKDDNRQPYVHCHFRKDLDVTTEYLASFAKYRRSEVLHGEWRSIVNGKIVKNENGGPEFIEVNVYE